ncbi:MAG: substrate-binding domain-containing protein [bacterium]
MITFRSNSKDPLHIQGAERIRKYIARQRLRQGDALPPVKELCDYLGLSYVTVHKALAVLARKGLVQPIRGKGTFVTGRGGAGQGPSQIGLVSVGAHASMLQQGYRLEMFRGIIETAGDQHVDVRMFSLKNPADRLSSQELRQMEIDGLLVMELTDPALMKRFVRSGVPVVVADSCLPDIPLNYVVCDNEGAATRSVKYLVEMGHRRIHYVGGATRHPVTNALVSSWDAEIRRRFYEIAMEQAGLVPVCHGGESGLDKKRVESLIKTCIRGNNRPTAVVTYDCAVAHQFIDGLKQAGISVPGDLSVVAVAGELTAEKGYSPLLSHNSFDFHGMGVQALRILMDRFSDPDMPMAQAAIHRVGFTFVEGETVATLRPS